MKNPMIIFLTLAVVAIGVGTYTFSQKSTQSDSLMKVDTQDSMEKAETSKPEAMEEKEDEMMEKDSARYTEYSKASLDGAVSNRRVLFFYASWCPTCRPADASLKAKSSKIPSDMTVIRVNYNDPETDQEERELAKKYSITYQHTYVQIDSGGKEIAKWNGGQINELLSNIK